MGKMNFDNIEQYKNPRNYEWTPSRLRRLKGMEGYHLSLIYESFQCDHHHLKIGRELLAWMENANQKYKYNTNGRHQMPSVWQGKNGQNHTMRHMPQAYRSSC